MLCTKPSRDVASRRPRRTPVLSSNKTPLRHRLARRSRRPLLCSRPRPRCCIASRLSRRPPLRLRPRPRRGISTSRSHRPPFVPRPRLQLPFQRFCRSYIYFRPHRRIVFQLRESRRDRWRSSRCDVQAARRLPIAHVRRPGYDLSSYIDHTRTQRAMPVMYYPRPWTHPPASASQC